MYDRHCISSCCICFTITDFFLFSYYIALIHDFKRFSPVPLKKSPGFQCFSIKILNVRKKA